MCFYFNLAVDAPTVSWKKAFYDFIQSWGRIRLVCSNRRSSAEENHEAILQLDIYESFIEESGRCVK
jgi:hypothetical protein